MSRRRLCIYIPSGETKTDLEKTNAVFVTANTVFVPTSRLF